MSEIIVVGAGVGGLAAAVRLQALGHRVTVLEQADEIGGKLGVVEVDGFLFDTGPSLVTMPYVLEELFFDTGSPASEVLDLQRLAPAARYRFPDGTILDMPGTLDAIPDALDAVLGPGTGAQWAAFLARAEAIWDATHVPFLESPLGGPLDMLRMSARVKDLATIAPWQSLRGLGRQYLTDPRLLMLLDRYATYTGSDPRHAPAALATVPWAEQSMGSWYVRGGLTRIAAALRDRLESLGGSIETGAEVVELTASSGRADGVILANGTRRRADIVVANADAREIYCRLLPSTLLRGATKRVARQVSRTTRSLSGFVLLLAVDDPPDDVAHHHLLFAEDYDDEFDSVFGRASRFGRRGSHPRPVPRPTIYISAPDDPAIVPESGTAAWFVLVNAPPHDPTSGVDWTTPGQTETYADTILEVMAERGVDVRSKIRHRILRSPADLERLTMTPGGSIYGSSSNGARAAFLRPANRSPVPGLYLVGGSAHPGGGLPLVMSSGKIVAEMIGQA